MTAISLHSGMAGESLPANPARQDTGSHPVRCPDAGSVRAATRGDMAAFEQIAVKYKRQVFGIAAKYAWNHHELEDLTQEIFIKVWKGLGSFRGDAPFEHWLMRLSVRACLDFLRRNRNRRAKEVSAADFPGFFRDQLEVGATPSQTEETHAFLEVRQALSVLKPEEQMVLVMTGLEERSLREVAELTGWPETTVKIRAFRARRSLKKAIERLREAEKRSAGGA